MGVAIRVIGVLILIAAFVVPVVMYFLAKRKASRGRA